MEVWREAEGTWVRVCVEAQMKFSMVKKRKREEKRPMRGSRESVLGR